MDLVSSVYVPIPRCSAVWREDRVGDFDILLFGNTLFLQLLRRAALRAWCHAVSGVGVGELRLFGWGIAQAVAAVGAAGVHAGYGSAWGWGVRWLTNKAGCSHLMWSFCSVRSCLNGVYRAIASRGLVADDTLDVETSFVAQSWVDLTSLTFSLSCCSLVKRNLMLSVWCVVVPRA